MIWFLLALVLAALHPTIAALHVQWTHVEAMTHGYLVAAVFLWLIWRRRTAGGASGSESALLWALLAGSGLVWAFGVRAGIEAVEWLLLPIVLWLAVRVALGPVAGRQHLFAVAWLYFAVPLWEFVNPVFQWGTVYVVRGLLWLTGVPAHFDESFVQIPAGSFEIAGGCSGLHFVIVALAVAALTGELREDAWRERIKLLALALVIAVVTNWLRVYSIILLGHLSHMQNYLVAESHYAYGWVLFAIAMTCFFLLERRIEVNRRPPASPMLLSTTTAAVRPLHLRTAAVAGTLAAVAAVTLLSARPAGLHSWETWSDAGWSSRHGEELEWQPRVDGADVHRSAVYRDQRGHEVELHAFLFLMQRQGKELGGYSNDLFGSMRVVSAASATLAGGAAMLYELRDQSGGAWLQAVSYEAAGRRFHSPLPAQVSYAVYALLRLRSDVSAVYLWRTPCIPDCARARELLGKTMMTEHEGHI